MDDAFGGDGPAMTMQFYAFLTASVNDDRFSWFVEVAMVGTFRIDSKDSVADLAHFQFRGSEIRSPVLLDE